MVHEGQVTEISVDGIRVGKVVIHVDYVIDKKVLFVVDVLKDERRIKNNENMEENRVTEMAFIM